MSCFKVQAVIIAVIIEEHVTGNFRQGNLRWIFPGKIRPDYFCVTFQLLESFLPVPTKSHLNSIQIPIPLYNIYLPEEILKRSCRAILSLLRTSYLLRKYLRRQVARNAITLNSPKLNRVFPFTSTSIV